MALEGTLKDFSIADILQLIGIQRKTGVLTLDNDEDTVTVRFFEGQVVGADTKVHNLEDLLGSVLVRTGRITEASLQQALRIQKETLQRLGYILLKTAAIDEGELKESLRIQVCQIVYRLFRWKDGRYQFAPSERMEYDPNLFMPVGAETILMEGARMIDEWPIIERRIRSAALVFKKTPAAVALEVPVECLVTADMDFGFGAATAEDHGGSDGGIRLSPEEQDVLRMVDGRANVQEIVDRSALGEFDTYRVLYELLNRQLVEEVRAASAAGVVAGVGRGAMILEKGLPIVVLALAALSLLTIPGNPFTPWNIAAKAGETDLLRSYASRSRLERIEHALQLFYLDLGGLPDGLESLVPAGYLRDQDLRDPWGRPYAFQLGSGGYRLSGRDSSGGESEDLTLSHSFSASERMVLDGGARPDPGKVKKEKADRP
jgi:hypothetical protein